MRFKPIFCLLLLCLGWHLSQGETTSPSLAIPLITLIPASNSAGDQSQSHEPRSVSQSELDPSEAVYELQKLSNFTDGLKALNEIYNTDIDGDDDYDPTQIIGKNFKKAMDASRKCGIILYDGLKIEELQDYFRLKNEENDELTTYRNVTVRLEYVFIKLCGAIDSAYSRYQTIAFSIVNERVMTDTLRQTCKTFTPMLGHYYNTRVFDDFKEKCQITSTNEQFVEQLENSFEDYLESENYSDALFISSHKLYKLILEFDMATYPMCEIFKEGIPTNTEASKRAQKIISVLQRVNKKFKELNYKRQYYWSTDNIVRIVKTYILGENTTDFTGDNSKIANNILKDLDENYKSLGYIYHVSVSVKTGSHGYNDTLLQCLTECKYIYNINGKDVYIIRNKRGQTYKECKFLPTSDLTYCGSDRDPRDLQELAKQIQEKCNPTAFSLIRSARENRYSNYYPDKNLTPAFTQKCFGDISLTMANNF